MIPSRFSLNIKSIHNLFYVNINGKFPPKLELELEFSPNINGKVSPKQEPEPSELLRSTIIYKVSLL